jgi:hypothetical protein
MNDVMGSRWRMPRFGKRKMKVVIVLKNKITLHDCFILRATNATTIVKNRDDASRWQPEL